MPKHYRLTCIFLLFIAIRTFAQIPDRPNRLDKDSLRTGEWVVLYDSAYENEVFEIKDATYYCLIDFKANRPMDLVECFLPNGIKQFEGRMLSFDPMVKHGQAISYHPNGVIESKVNYNYDSLEGPFEMYHDNGLLSGTGLFKDNKRTGNWEYYGKNGIISSTFQYENGKENGWSVYYHPNGQKQSEGRYENGLSEGKWLTYYPSGQVQIISNFEKGVLKGKSEFYYESGALEEVNFKVDGKLHGKITSYYENGNIRSENHYVHGMKHGLFTYYHDNGQIESTGQMVEDASEGPWVFYYPNGQVKSRGKFVAGAKHGHWQFYEQNGDLQSEGYLEDDLWEGWARLYTDGYISSAGEYAGDIKNGCWEYYNSAGQITDIETFDKGKTEGYFESLYEDLTLKYFGRMSNDVQDGEWRFYHANGQLSSIQQFDQGALHGAYVSYFDNGLKQKEGAYLNGKLDGFWRYYFENGQVKSEGNYQNHLREGQWNYYHANGQLSSMGIYENDLSQGIWKYYYENGTLKKEGLELDNKLHGHWTYYTSQGSKEMEGDWRHDLQHGPWTYYEQDGSSSSTTYHYDKPLNFSTYYDSAVVLSEDGSHKEAFRIAKTAKQIQIENYGKDRISYCNVYALYSNLYQNRGKHGKAIKQSAMAVDHARNYEPDTSSWVISNLSALAYGYRKAGNNQKALEIYKEVLDIVGGMHQGIYSSDYDNSIYNYIWTLGLMGRETEAFQTYKEFVEMQLEEGTDSLDIVENGLTLVQKAQNIDSNEYALNLARYLIEYSQAKELTNFYTYPLLRYAKAIEVMDTDYEASIDILKESIFEHFNVSDTTSNQFFETLNYLGNYYYSRGLYDSANIFFNEALWRFEGLGVSNDYLYPKLLIGSAMNLHMLHESERMKSHFDKALEIYNKAQDPDSVLMSKAHQGIALYYQDLQQNDDAERHFQQAVDLLSSRTGYQYHYANAMQLYAGFLEKIGKYKQAISVLRQLDVYRSKFDEDDNIGIQVAMLYGKTYYHLQNLDSALHYLNSSYELASEALTYNSIEAAEALREIADIYEDKTDYVKAQSYNLKALNLLEEQVGKNNLAYVITLEETARNFELQLLYPTAIEYYKRALSQLELVSGNTFGNQQFIKMSLANAQRLNNQPDLALQTLLSVKTDLEAAGWTGTSRYIRCLRFLTYAYEHEKIKDFNQAEKYMLAMLKAAAKYYGENNAQYAIELDHISSFYSRNYDYIQAKPYQQKAIDITLNQIGKGLEYAEYLDGMSWIQFNLGNYPLAISQKEVAIEIFKNEAPDGSDYLDAIYSLGEYYSVSGRFEEAIKTYERTIEIVEHKYGTFSYAIAGPLVYIASTYYSWNKPEDALTYLDRTESLFDSLGSSEDTYLKIHNLKGLCLTDLRRLEESKTHFESALRIAEKLWPDDPNASAAYRNNLAFYYLLNGEFHEAEKLWLSAKSFMTSGTSLQKVAWLDNMATLYQSWEKMDQAETYWKETLNILFEKIEMDFPYLSESGKTAFWDAYKEDFEYFNSFAVKSSKSGNTNALRDMYDNHIRTKSLLLSTSTKERQKILASNDSILIALYRQYIAAKEQLAKYYGYTKEQLTAEGINLVEKETSANRLEKVLSMDADALSHEERQAKIRWKDIQRALAPGEAAIEIIRYRNFDKVVTDSVIYAALILTSDARNHPVLVPLANGNELEGKYLKAYLTSIKYQLKDQFSYKQYWEAIDKQLKGIKTIYLSMDGVYNQISLGTLEYPDGSYLLDHYDLHLLTSTKSIITRKYNQKKSFFSNVGYLFGYPKYDLNHSEIEMDLQERGIVSAQTTERATDMRNMSFAELPGTREETEGIYNLLTDRNWEINLYLQNEALEDELKRVSNPRLLHIATHGFFLEDSEETSNPMQLGINVETSQSNPLLRSGLLMAGATQTAQGNHKIGIENGVFTAYEAMNLDLHDTELVVLSACETGRGEIKNGEGVYGLQRAFQIAGSESIIMSLWKVDDQATQLLMNNFYDAWLQNKSKADALKTAQMKVREQYSNPYYWGAFVLVE
ncbi:MAG: CHAT domain-containing protein [Marinoscillum sp.]